MKYDHQSHKMSGLFCIPVFKAVIWLQNVIDIIVYSYIALYQWQLLYHCFALSVLFINSIFIVLLYSLYFIYYPNNKKVLLYSLYYNCTDDSVFKWSNLYHDNIGPNSSLSIKKNLLLQTYPSIPTSELINLESRLTMFIKRNSWIEVSVGVLWDSHYVGNRELLRFGCNR